MAEVKFRREVGLQYAEDNSIELPDKVKDKALERIIRDFVGNERDFVCPVEDGGCTFANGDPVYVQDDDKYCWRCGFDCGEEGAEGGYDNLFGGDKNKKIHTVDRTGDDKPPGKPGKKPTKDEAKTEPAKTTAVAKKTEPEASVIPLDKRVAEIRLLDASTGAAAWRIGQHFVEIMATDQFRDLKYKDMDKFLAKELDMSRPTMQMYVRIAERFEEADAGTLPIHKLEVIGRADPEDRPKMLKAALPKSEGGKGMDRKQLAEKLAEIKDTGENGGETRGRPRKSKFSKMVGKKFKGKKENNSHQFYVCLDGKDVPKENQVWLEIDIDGATASVEVAQFTE